MSEEIQEFADEIDPNALRLDDHLRLAEQFVKGWSGSFLEIALRRATLSPVVHQVVLANCVRQIRTLRSILTLGRDGDAVGGFHLLRSMFEPALSVGFVMKPTWTHTARGKKEKWSPEFRAFLVLARDHSMLDLRSSRLKDKASKKSQVTVALGTPLFDPQKVAAEVGTKWMKVVSTEPYTVTGQPIEELAGQVSIELASWHAAIEGNAPASNGAEFDGEYIVRNVEGSLQAAWTSAPERSLTLLRNAIHLVSFTLGQVDQHADIGIGGRSMLSGLREQLLKLSV